MPCCSWSEFADHHGINLPQRRDIPERLNVNLGYYSSNYLCIIATFFLYVIIRHPWFILGFALESALFVYLFWYRTQAIVIGSRPVSRRDLAIGYAVLATTISLLFGGWVSVKTFALAVTLIMLHALLRTRSLKARGTAFIDMLTTKPHSDAVHSGSGTGQLRHSMSAGDLFASTTGNTPTNGFEPQNNANSDAFKSQFRASMRQKYLKK